MQQRQNSYRHSRANGHDEIEGNNQPQQTKQPSHYAKLRQVLIPHLLWTCPLSSSSCLNTSPYEQCCYKTQDVKPTHYHRIVEFPEWQGAVEQRQSQGDGKRVARRCAW